MDLASGSGAAAAKVHYLKDYRPPGFLVDTVDLTFDLREDDTLVRARTVVRRNPEAGPDNADLWLDGEELGLVSIALDGAALPDTAYKVTAEGLRLFDAPDRAELEIATRIRPDRNTALQGLYVSNGNFFTQCEAEGFRRITYFPDRPDVMATYRTRIIADKARFPVLLSNGNLIGQGDVTGEASRHWAEWHDPFPKPSYLFALVAGDLAVIDDSYVTGSGRAIHLQIFVEPADLDKCAHAMTSLKKAMAWDEEVYGLEYDLDRFMVVAVSDFNMGAMENKGLNIFNTKCVLAKPETATDTDYEWIESVVAHEYFHNWTGNRVTCRDWFQLSLKEGLTVFRDQQFSADMGSADVARIESVRQLRASQFPEDSGPLAHPVRPESYIEINNFYTPTVYNKGAELVRMIHHILGPDGYRQGIDLYFERHDGQAVTIEDFLAAMEDANGVELGQFRLWYAQAGTPRIDIDEAYDGQAGTLTLTVEQKTEATPGQATKLPLHVPLVVGLIAPDGGELPVRLAGDNAEDPAPTTRTLHLTKTRQEFVLTGLEARPTLSPLRGFSAPVRLEDRPLDALKTQFAHDADPFARWEAGQQLASRLLLDMALDVRAGRPVRLDPDFSEAVERTIRSPALDDSLKAQAVTLPSLAYLSEQMAIIDIEAIDGARTAAQRAIAEALHPLLRETYRAKSGTGPYRFEPAEVGRRALRNCCLRYLSHGDDNAAALDLAARQLEDATNMTDRLAALAILNDHEGARRAEALGRFFRDWQDDALVIDKWFTLQAQTRLPDALGKVEALTDHPAFTWTNPNRVRALVGGFANGNPLRFHGKDGSGYRFLADCIMRIDPMNPQLAARMVAPLGRWRRHGPAQSKAMEAALRGILSADDLSKDTFEIVSKSLAES